MKITFRAVAGLVQLLSIVIVGVCLINLSGNLADASRTQKTMRDAATSNSKISEQVKNGLSARGQLEVTTRMAELDAEQQNHLATERKSQLTSAAISGAAAGGGIAIFLLASAVWLLAGIAYPKSNLV